MGKHPIYPAYKASGVEWLGEIPVEWSMKQIRFLFNIHNGSTPRSSETAFWEGDIVWITPEDLGDNNGKEISTSRRKITPEGYINSGTSLASAGSIVVSTRAPIGHLAKTTTEACVNQGCRILEPIEGGADFWYYCMIAAKPELQSLGQGTTFLEVPRQKLASMKLPNPPLPEQEAIARFLDEQIVIFDEQSATIQAAIDKLKEYRTALITHAVTGKIDVRSISIP